MQGKLSGIQCWKIAAAKQRSNESSLGLVNTVNAFGVVPKRFFVASNHGIDVPRIPAQHVRAVHQRLSQFVKLSEGPELLDKVVDRIQIRIAQFRFV